MTPPPRSTPSRASYDPPEVKVNDPDLGILGETGDAPRTALWVASLWIDPAQTCQVRISANEPPMGIWLRPPAEQRVTIKPDSRVTGYPDDPDLGALRSHGGENH